MNEKSTQIVSTHVAAENLIPCNNDRREGTTCKVCQSGYRVEADEMYDEFLSLTKVHKFLLSKKVQISYGAVKAHINNHHLYDIDVENMRSYASVVSKWIGLVKDKETSLRSRMAMLEKEMWGLAAQSDEMKGEEKRKNVDLVRRLAETLLSYESKLAEFQDDVDPARLVLDQLKIVIMKRIKTVNSQEVKKEIAGVLEDLKKSDIGSLLVEVD